VLCLIFCFLPTERLVAGSRPEASSEEGPPPALAEPAAASSG
jgi:hypothetical protein